MPDGPTATAAGDDAVPGPGVTGGEPVVGPVAGSPTGVARWEGAGDGLEVVVWRVVGCGVEGVG
ncbi:MAG TPA: hypothetical protein VET24_07480, partial [Actinomycetota bacterium]|nr:hypothetical protein [Actinomycetota bacterium]